MSRDLLLSTTVLLTTALALFGSTTLQSTQECAEGGCCPKQPASCGEGSYGEGVGQGAISDRDGELLVLQDSLAPLTEHFNDRKDLPRVVALLSPTCPGCVHAARALVSEITEKRPGEDLSVTVVWVPMLPSDNEQTAVRAAGLFQDERVTQFYDPARLSGVAWSRDLFASLAQRALSSNTPHGFPTSWIEVLAAKPEQAPIWDVVFFYPGGVEWQGKAPVPADWSKQTCFHASDENGATGVFAVRDLDGEAVNSDWFVEVATGVDALLAGHPRTDQVVGLESPPSSRIEGHEPRRFLVPDQAPEFFQSALARAQEKSLPLVIDFGAEWCNPCQRLKKETLVDPRVAAALTGVELVYVDIDKHPQLARFYGVQSIPDLLFVSREGLVVDRLHSFEAAGEFLGRLERVRKAANSEAVGECCSGE